MKVSVFLFLYHKERITGVEMSVNNELWVLTLEQRKPYVCFNIPFLSLSPCSDTKFNPFMQAWHL